jgi:hypothetical protein
MIGEAIPALTAWGASSLQAAKSAAEGTSPWTVLVAEDQGENNHNFVLHGHVVLLSKPRSSSGQPSEANLRGVVRG